VDDIQWVQLTITQEQLPMLTVGQHDKKIRDLRNSKVSRELSGRSMWIVVSGVHNKVSNPVLSL
jgi:hypothetical protein